MRVMPNTNSSGVKNSNIWIVMCGLSTLGVNPIGNIKIHDKRCNMGQPTKEYAKQIKRILKNKNIQIMPDKLL